jgi:methionyl-tRNA formyltransferase
MKMDAGVDTGDMIKKLTTPLSLHWTVIDLIQWIKNQ